MKKNSKRLQKRQLKWQTKTQFIISLVIMLTLSLLTGSILISANLDTKKISEIEETTNRNLVTEFKFETPTIKPTTEPITQPVTVEPTETITELATETIIEKVTEPITEPTTEKVTETITETKWQGEVLNAVNGTVEGPSGRETYYNLNMSGVISIMKKYGYSFKYWVRSDGCKMYGKYIMCAANFDIRPRGSIVETTLGPAIVCDTGGFAKFDPNRIDIAVTW